MEISLLDGKLLAKLEGKIDSTNSEQFKNEIMPYFDNNDIKSVELDCLKLSYISSAGLRVILNIAKICKDLTVSNVNTEVYNVLEMTGFTEMMKVVSAYREISVEGCEVIGVGAMGKVYKIDNENIVKTYLNPESLENIKRERELARTALVLGLPTSISYEVVKVGPGYGSVFEMLNAESFAKLFNTDDENEFNKYLDLYVNLLKDIHSKNSDHPLLADAKKRFLDRIQTIKNQVDELTYNKILSMASEIPDSNTVLHGDFHVKNVMMQGDEVMLIDMDTLAKGDIIFEFAGMYEAYIGYNSRTEEETFFLGLPNSKCLKIYNGFVRKYFSNKSEEEILELLNKIECVGAIDMLSYVVKDPEFFGNEKGFNIYRNILLNVVTKINDLKLN